MLDENEPSEWLTELDNKYHLKKKEDSVVGEEKPAAKQNELPEPRPEQDDESGVDAYLRWRFLKEKQWAEQEKLIHDIDKQISSLRTYVENPTDRPPRELLRIPRIRDLTRRD